MGLEIRTDTVLETNHRDMMVESMSGRNHQGIEYKEKTDKKKTLKI